MSRRMGLAAKHMMTAAAIQSLSAMCAASRITRRQLSGVFAKTRSQTCSIQSCGTRRKTYLFIGIR